MDNLRHDLRVWRRGIAVQLKAGMALRGAFGLQVLGMVMNNLGLMVAWLLFFDKFGAINGWMMQAFLGLQGVNMFIYGICMLTSVGILDLPKHVDQGSFDNLLTRPSSVISQLASSNFDATTFGDILPGIVLMGWFGWVASPDFWQVLAFLLTLAAGCVIFWSFVILLPNTLAFWFFDSEKLVRYWAYVSLDGSMYPTGILRGALRGILLTVVPALFLGAVPVDILRGANMWTAGLAVVIAGAWLTFALWFFRHSIRRYESANMTGAR